MSSTHELRFAYAHPHPAVATDIAIFTLLRGRLHLLLIQRGAEPFHGAWALPGGFLGPDEDLDTCARRELREETGVDARLLQNFGNFSAPDRDPRERVISVAYLALLPAEAINLRADTDATEARWFAIGQIPNLAFDHDDIVLAALSSLRTRLKDLEVLFALLPKKFTLTELQTAYEAIAGETVEKRNFRKLALGSGHLRETAEFIRGSHRPARLFEVNDPRR